MRGVFITGTDTGVGKSVVAAAILARLTAGGTRAVGFKPVVTGLAEQAGAWPADHELLASAAGDGQRPAEVAPVGFGPPASPHYAAELAGVELRPFELVRAARSAAAGAEAIVCEGVGGLLVPLTEGFLIRDLAVALGLPLVVAARTGLGTINHTLLTLEAARAAGLEVRAVVMTPWPHAPTDLERSNRDTVERIGRVPVAVLPGTTPARLADAARELPVDDWLG